MLTHLTPGNVWRYFEELCRIPHPSKHEQQIAAYVKEFCRLHGLYYTVDRVGNLLIRKPAFQGYEDRTGIILQAHLDMVPQKNTGVSHNFLHDPVQPWIDGEWVKAKDTTLGADNGIGVAAILAVLESSDLHHGPLEALLTIDEETGMTGVAGLEKDWLRGRILLNLDTEEEGELCIGCAGGLNATVNLPVQRRATPRGSMAARVMISGLRGGHSGCDIHLGRANAIKLIGRFLWEVQKITGLKLSAFDGGTLRNAIPREASAVFVVPLIHRNRLIAAAKKYRTNITAEYHETEPELLFEMHQEEMPSTVLSARSQSDLLDLIYALPHGVINTIRAMPGITETSTNMAAVHLRNNRVEILNLLRSSSPSAKSDLARRMAAVSHLAGATIRFSGEYPGWTPHFDAPVLSQMKKIYFDLFGSEPKITVVHAGLECGIIGDKYPELQMVSLGPTILYPHSPGEKVNIPSVERFWNYLVHVLEKIQ